MFEEQDVWAVAYGPPDRDYFDDVFRPYDVALVGCDGIQEDYRTANLEENPEFQKLGRNRKTAIRTVGRRVKEGDLVIAKQGTRHARTVGLVVKDYSYNPGWGEIQSWDLFHQLRVKWASDEDRYFEGGKRPFTMGAGHRVSHPDAVAWARDKAERELKGFISNPELADLPSSNLALLAESEIPRWFHDAKQIAESLIEAWSWDGISETSVVAHLLVPMLMDLGWERDQIRLELDWIDIAVFADPEEQPVLLIEAKNPKFGASGAFRQVQSYLDQKSTKRVWKPDEIAVMATNGFSFILRAASGERSDAFLFGPTSRAKSFFEGMERLALQGSRTS